MAWYMQVVRFSEPYEYAGADLLASWYQRNVRIYSNIVKLADPPAGCSVATCGLDDSALKKDRPIERILVIYGAGHLTLLRQLAAEDPNVRLRKLSDFANH